RIRRAPMPTQLRSDTARANGAKSHGPATAEGCAKSSRNAVKHGLFSRNPLVLECETDDDFEAWKSTSPPPQPRRIGSIRWSPPAGASSASRASRAASSTAMRQKKKLELEFPSGCS